MKTYIGMPFAFSLGLFYLTTFVIPTAVFAAEPVDVKLDSGDSIRIEALSPVILRVRLSSDGTFSESMMERYGIVRKEWPAAKVSRQETADGEEISTGQVTFTIRHRDGRMSLRDNQGKMIIEKIEPVRSALTGAEQEKYQTRLASMAEYFKGNKDQTERQVLWGEWDGKKSDILGDPTKRLHPAKAGTASIAGTTAPFGVSFSLKDEERFYGLGAASAKRIQLRGHGYRNWAEYRDGGGFDERFAKFEQTEGPNPFVMSTGGWAIFVNTTWLHFFDIGRMDKDQMFVWGPHGNLDFYLMASTTLPALIELHTEITGKPILLPKWGYGLTYVGNISDTQHDTLHDALEFRERDIPCNIIGLEPQWMKKYYDFSHKKEWNSPGRFYMEDWLPRSASMIGALDRMGYKLSLWLCCDDDLTIEEERQAAKKAGNPQSVTDETEAWFEHLKKFVDKGVAAFKIDPSNIINVHQDRTYFNGSGDLEIHNLSETLIHKQMQEGYENYTKQRAMVHFCGNYAGVQHWGGSTMGDNGGGEKALVWMLNFSMSGHSNTTADMDVIPGGGLASGMHFGFLMPWSQHNNWASSAQPWFLGEKGFRMFRDYAKLRYRLLPYIYSAAIAGFKTGMPIMRPMPLVFPDDRTVDNLTHQYMFGESFLVNAFTDKLYMPAGKWIDYWTGKQYEGPKQFKPEIPENRGGALFVRAGAIIPCSLEESSDIASKETIALEIWPEGDSQFTLYEDDGESLDYKNGAMTETGIHCSKRQDKTVLTLNPRKGQYKNMPEKRNFTIIMHQAKPTIVRINGNDLIQGKDGWNYDPIVGIIRLHAGVNSEYKTPVVIELYEKI